MTDIAAELPLVVIAELLGVPNEDRHRMFDWSNRMIGSDDPEYQTAGEVAQMASMELYAYASELFATKRVDPHDDLMSVLTQVEIDGEQLSSLRARAVLPPADRGRQRDDPEPHLGGDGHLLRPPRPVGAAPRRPVAPARRRRGDAPLRHPGHELPAPDDRRPSSSGGQKIEADSKVVFFHISANRDETAFADPQTFDITRNPNPHMAFGAGGPHFCLGANLARMEIRVMFEHLLDRMPDMELAGDVQRLQSAFISGVKHIPITFPTGPRVTAG